MKKRVFYRYNRNTLSYERIKKNWLQQIGQMTMILTATAFYGWGLWTLAAPQSLRDYVAEKQLITAKIQETNQKLDLMGAALVDLKERDQNLYSPTLDLNQIDDSEWEYGVGGSVKHPELQQLQDGAALVEMAEKLQKIRHQMSMVAASQDKLLTKTSKAEKRMRAIPAIRPLLRLERALHLSSGFGMRRNPFNKSVWQMHPGIDLGAPMGAPIFATGDGTVVRVEHKRSGYGFNVVIDHGYGYKTLYGHMCLIDAKVGKKVQRGEIIGYVGSTGYSTSPHVHYEVFINNKRVDPEPYIADMTTEQIKTIAKSVDPEVSFSYKRRRSRRRR